MKSRPVAQLAERRSPKPKGGGSIPPWPVVSFGGSGFMAEKKSG